MNAYALRGTFLADSMWVEIRGPEWHRMFSDVPIDIRNQRQDSRRVGPLIATLRFSHYEEFAEGEGIVVDADDAGELVNEAINLFASASRLI